MRLILLHPEVAFRDCAHCLKYDYDEATGKPRLWRGAEMERPPGKKFAAPCRRDPENGCAKGTAENPKTLSASNWKAFAFYRECEAVQSWPDDPIVRMCAAIVRPILDNAKFAEEQRLTLAKLRSGTTN